MKLYSYIVSKDLGLAPNPFWGYCTVALCTPNHMGIKAEFGDWIVGFSPASQGNQVVYAMQVSEILSFDEYYNDRRFAKKKPDLKGSWKEICGDNLYYKDPQGNWTQHRTFFHREPEVIEKDLRHPFVFVAEKYYYFGDKAVSAPVDYQNLVWKRQGCKCQHDPLIVESFLNWLKTNFVLGVHGTPKDNEEAQKASCCEE